MTVKQTWWVVVAFSLGCANNAPATSSTPTRAASPSQGEEVVAEANEWWVAVADDAAELAGLPPAPWNETPVGRQSASEQLLSAWSRAANREWCAPLYVTDLENARTRPLSFAGGWGVEFDKQGMPGTGDDGAECTACGQRVFGIAGTNITVAEADPGPEAGLMTWSDGSVASLESHEQDKVAVATLKIAGQDCLYQVWSRGGTDHLKELLGDLRFVAGQ